MNTDREIGRRIHLILWDRNLPQKALAERLGLGSAAMSMKLKGQRPWTVTEVLTAADWFDVPVVDLFPEQWTAPEPSKVGGRRRPEVNSGCLSSRLRYALAA